MVDENEALRRRTVIGALAAGVASLAGCGNPLSDAGGNGTGDGNGTTDENGTDGNDTTSGNDTTGGNGTRGNDTTGGNGTANQSSDALSASGTIRLGGETAGWTGEEPEAIAGETNPTLRLQAGTTYEIVWDNLDGQEHELILADGNGEEVEASESSSTEGETVSLEFTASRDLAEYFCEYHPDSMRGGIEVVAGE